MDSLSKDYLVHLLFKLYRIRKIILVPISVLFLGFLFFEFFFPPSNFPIENSISIEKGMGLHQVSSLLKEKDIIRSRFVFEAIFMLYGKDNKIKQYDYFFQKKLFVWQVARAIAKGEHNMPLVSVTIPEGFDNNKIANTTSLVLKNFNKSNFLEKTNDLQGYLFPDTYFLFSSANESDLIASMRDNFKKKINNIIPEISKRGKNLDDILKMASLLEAEAAGEVDKGYISGILWKRLSINMPLQADAAPETYKKKGLPQKPINNPGMSSILVAINPKDSPYLYYLHDSSGKIYFAKNFEEHKQNKAKYLKK